MRIIAGIHRSRKLQGPRPGDLTTRPILDRVKQALFDRLWNMGMFPEPDAEGTLRADGNVLDIFSGTGSMGLEALSRGSAHCTFIERDRYALTALRENITALGCQDEATVLSVDALSLASINLLPRKPVRLVFLDPPYEMMLEEDKAARVAGLIAALGTMPGVAPGDRPGVMEPTGVLVLRTPIEADPPTVAGWSPPEVHAYGKMRLAFYRKATK